ncbi:MAG: T9SS type A sorting domain-containing protein, partial [Candidatus Kapabacteria bacterium]|nr:T9SS type A sorting domain-containing protein [Candidatus Kapabacteria bacterium]
SFPSYARRYGTGLELVNGDLIATERDGEQRIVKMDPVTGALRSSAPNPLRSTYGPRSIAADGLGNLVQIHTSFPPGGGKLSSVLAVELPLPQIDVVRDQLVLESRGGLINARGIEIDQRDQSMWVSDIDGVIWKIAGMNYVPPTTSVSENVVAQENISIAPHPVTTYALITVAPIGRERVINTEIYDVTGRRVLTLPRTFQTSTDAVTHRIHAETLQAGAYVIRVSSDENQDVRRTFVVSP